MTQQLTPIKHAFHSFTSVILSLQKNTLNEVPIKANGYVYTISEYSIGASSSPVTNDYDTGSLPK